jgi:hypothetical protein
VVEVLGRAGEKAPQGTTVSEDWGHMQAIAGHVGLMLRLPCLLCLYLVFMSTAALAHSSQLALMCPSA